MTKPGCPSEHELLAFLLGDRTVGGVGDIAAHTAACTECGTAAERLDRLAATVAATLRAHQVDSTVDARSGADAVTGAFALVGGATAPAAGPGGLSEGPPGYEILGRLGRGGMGEVFKARHRRLNRVVALKQFRGGSESAAARFRMEADAVARLQHPNIVQIYEVGGDEGRGFLALEYVEGGSLDRALTGAPVPPREAATLIRALALAVHHAHGQGIVHRDLKPANVLLAAPSDPGRAGPTPKVTDFGIARLAGSEDALTRDGDVLGTPSYMAPEQAGGRVERIGPATDVYSLGVMLYELMTGRVPFSGLDAVQTMLLLQSQDPVPPRRLNPRLPRDLETVCLKCLEKEPARRYGSADALAGDLGRWLEGRPILARPVGPAARAGLWARRRPATAGLAAALVAVAAASFVAVAAQWRRARANFRESEANLRIAREAIDKFTVFGDDRLKDQPHLMPVRTEMLRTARDFYQRFVGLRSSDPALRDDLARSLFNLGKITGEIGSPKDAVAYLERSERILDDLARSAGPGEARRLRARAARCEFHIGNILMDNGDLGAARVRLERALATQRELAGGRPDAAHIAALAETLDALGKALKGAGDRDGSSARFREALDRCEAWARLAPGDPKVAYRRSAILNGLGQDRLAQGDPAGAAGMFRQSLGILDGLHAENPGNTTYAVDLFALNANLGHVAFETPPVDRERALTYYERSRGLIDRLVDSYPSAVEFWEKLGLLYADLGNVYRALGRADRAREVYRSVLDRLPARAAAHPDRPGLRDSVYFNHARMGALLEDEGDLDAARDEFLVSARGYESLAREVPGRPLYRSEGGVGLLNAGRLSLRLGRAGEAERESRGAVAAFEPLAAAPGGAEDAAQLGASLAQLGQALARGGRGGEARAAFERAALVLEPVVSGPARDRLGGDLLGQALRAHAEAREAVGRPDATRPGGDGVAEAPPAGPGG